MSADEPGDRRAHGGHFLAAPLDNRIYMRAPDGVFIVVGEATGLVEGPLAEQMPAGGETGGADGR